MLRTPTPRHSLRKQRASDSVYQVVNTPQDCSPSNQRNIITISKLREYRERNKKSYQWIAAQIGDVNWLTVRRAIKGIGEPSELTILKIAEFLKKVGYAA